MLHTIPDRSTIKKGLLRQARLLFLILLLFPLFARVGPVICFFRVLILSPLYQILPQVQRPIYLMVFSSFFSYLSPTR